MNDAEIRLQVILDDKNSTKDLDNKVKKTTDSTNKLKDAGKSIGKAFLKGATVAGGALTTMIGASIKGYADLEQSIGGVETLFKDSADTVIANAKKAYETAGMDANTYMETVTSFSASLLQGLGGDTKEAARIADMATKDMSDNANKMGTDINTIIQTYQSLARGNYAMLDNLKLGYGGTKKELERLVADAEKLSGLKLNPANFSDVIQAIHIVQDNLDITGTTALEASTTITGSFNSAKSALKNFLSGAGGVEDVVDTFSTFGKNVGKALVKMAPQVTSGLVNLVNGLMPQIPKLINSLLPVVLQGIINLINGLIPLIPTIIPIILNGLMILMQGLVPLIPQIVEALLEGLILIMTSLAEQMPVILPQVVSMIIQILQVINEHFDDFMLAGFQLILGLIQGFIKSIPTIIQNLPTIIMAIINFFTLSKFLKIGKTIVSGIWAGIKGMIGTFKDNISGFVNNILGWFKSGFSKIGDIGKNLVKGLWNGIKSVKDWVLGKIKGFGKSVLDGLKDFFGIHSPSKVMFEIGGYLDQGFINGVEDMQKDVDKQVTATFGSGLDYLYNGFDNISSSYSKPVNMNYGNNPIINVNVEADMDVNKFGKVFVNNVKTFSGGAKNSYNYGGAK